MGAAIAPAGETPIAGGYPVVGGFEYARLAAEDLLNEADRTGRGPV